MTFERLNYLRNRLGELLEGPMEQAQLGLNETHCFCMTPQGKLDCIPNKHLTSHHAVLFKLDADDLKRFPTSRRWEKIIAKVAKELEKAGVYERIGQPYNIRR
jgi:hypothetical protein